MEASVLFCEQKCEESTVLNTGVYCSYQGFFVYHMWLSL